MGKKRRKNKTYVTKRMRIEIENFYNDSRNFESFLSYFKGIVSWIKYHRYFIDDIWLRQNSMHTLLNIDAEKYVSHDPDISLDQEREREFILRINKMDLLVDMLGKTLWDLVDFPSGRTCPLCDTGGLSYFIYEDLKTKEKGIVLKCGVCSWSENVDGTHWAGGEVNLYPVNKEDLIKFGIFVK